MEVIVYKADKADIHSTPDGGEGNVEGMEGIHTEVHTVILCVSKLQSSAVPQISAYHTMVTSTLLYGVETWPVTQQDMLMEVNYTSKICNRKSKNPGRFDLGGLRHIRQVFTLPVAYFACIIDFRSYIDATMSFYSIKIC